MKDQLAKAIAFAAEKHKGQFDKGGMPYILHPITVMKYLETEDQELMAGAVMHDVVEDCKVTYDQLWMTGFTEKVVEIVRGMTKVPGETVNGCIKRMREGKFGTFVVKTKLADLRHNMDPRRLKGMAEKDVLRMNKYIYMYHMLRSGSEEYNPEYDKVAA